MKNTFLLLGTFISMHASMQAQININVARPVWGPVVTTEEYYYLPDIDSYYDIRQSQYIYADRGKWIRSRALPQRYHSYNLNTGRVVVIKDYHGKSPYVHYKNHKVKYFKNGNRGQGKGNAQGKHARGKGKGNKKEK